MIGVAMRGSNLKGAIESFAHQERACDSEFRRQDRCRSLMETAADWGRQEGAASTFQAGWKTQQAIQLIRHWVLK